jgi:hypothetical protein
VAPLLARLQPGFGWAGDLRVAGRAQVRSTPALDAAVVLERTGGDLLVTDETGATQALGLTDARLALDVHDGVWTFTQALAGQALGAASGAVVARTSREAAWPAPDTPLSGVLELQVANLGTWGPWVRRDGAWPAACARGWPSAGASGRRSTRARSPATGSACATSCSASTCAKATSRSPCRERARASSASRPVPATARCAWTATPRSARRRARSSRCRPTSSSC